LRGTLLQAEKNGCRKMRQRDGLGPREYDSRENHHQGNDE